VVLGEELIHLWVIVSPMDQGRLFAHYVDLGTIMHIVRT